MNRIAEMARNLSATVLRQAPAVLGALALLALYGPDCHALVKGEAVTFEYQVRNSDVILRGTCEDSVTTWSNGHIITTWKIAVKKYLKAPKGMTLKSAPVVHVSQVGGRISSPLPLEESYPMMAAVYPGEEVVLFLQSPDHVPQVVRQKYERLVEQGRIKPSPLMENFRLTTLNVSKLTVVKDPRSGTELVTRITFDRFGILPSAEALKRYVEAYESADSFVDIKTAEKTLRIPVQVGQAAAQTADIAAEQRQLTMEQRIARMKAFTSTWEDFQKQVEAVLQGKKTPGMPRHVGAVGPGSRIRTIQPRKGQ